MLRKNEIKIRLFDDELERLNRNYKKTYFSREGYIRLLLNGYIPVEMPPLEYRQLINELRAIGNNMHQIYYKACSQGFIDAPIYKENAEKVHAACMLLENLRVPVKIIDVINKKTKNFRRMEE